MKVVIVGGGFGGCAAAYVAQMQGADVTLIEKTDMLLGTGLVGGIIKNNGRYTILEELRLMGMEKFIEAIEKVVIHENIDFPGHNHASLYNVLKIENVIRKFLLDVGVKIILEQRISKANIENNKILFLSDDENNKYYADVFIDATGTGGPINNCIKYGNGCSMCILRCPTYKGRISLTNICKIKEYQLKSQDGLIGAMSGSCELLKESLSESLITELNSKGLKMVPIKDTINIKNKVCQQYALEEYQKNLVLLDNGHVKLMTSYYNIQQLHAIKGFENVKYIDPYAGGKGNSIRFLSIAPYDLNLKVKGIDNLFCCGEKMGLVGHTEAITTGSIAGYNATRLVNEKELLILSAKTAIGECISYVNNEIVTNQGLLKSYTASGSNLFNRLKELNLYITDINIIKEKMDKLNLMNIFKK